MLRSLKAFAAVISVCESAGASVPVALVQRADDADAAPVLSATEGALVLRDCREGREALALAQGVAALPAEVEYALLGATDAAPLEDALASMMRAIARGADVVVADRSDPAPYALFRRNLAASLLPESDPSLPPVLALVRAARSAGAAIVTVNGAGQQRVPGPPASNASLTGVEVGMADPGGLRVGTATYFGSRCSIRTWGPEERIAIGAYCSFADDIAVLHPGSTPRNREGRPVILPIRGAHHMQSASTYPISVLAPERDYSGHRPDSVLPSPPLVIGNDVWVGTQVLILGSVTIGDGAIIGAGAVIRRDVPPYAVVVGNPQQVTRRRFDDVTCDRIQSIAWWSWDPELVASNHRSFLAPGEAFADRFDLAGALG